MSRGHPGTTVRAWLLRRFRGRSREEAEAAWAGSTTPDQAPSATYALGGLTVAVVPVGVKAAGDNEPSLVFRVEISDGGGRTWASSYGFPPAASTPQRAAEAALDDLATIHSEPDLWRRQWTEGMSDDEAEAMLSSRAAEDDQRAAAWVGPVLAGMTDTGGPPPGGWLSLA